MKRNAIETIMGALVLVIAAAFVAFAYQTSDLNSAASGAYRVSAEFSNATGVVKGSDVRIGGVKIGVVDNMELDPTSYQAVLHLAVNQDVQLPADTGASIVGDGLLGSKFVALQPGADDRMLKEGGKIEYTQSSVSLEEMIGKFVFSAGGVDKEEEAEPASAPAASSAPALSETPVNPAPSESAEPEFSLP